MASEHTATEIRTGTYTNPVYAANFPDPFVMRFNGMYYAYSTDLAPDGRAFPMLSSRDLVHWTEHGGAVPLPQVEGAELYWAPEVAYHEGRFYLYYATGRDADPDHHLRVAVAEHPLGPWRDAGVNLTPHEIFAIDAHPFRDPRDGQWYLFYARDRMEAPYAGTGLAVDRLATMDRLAGEARDVLRPYADWQVFELQRAVKQGLDWYTIEGAFVRRIGDTYVCLYSGGRWEHPNYGVGYAHAESVLGPWTDDSNKAGPVILTTVPGRIIGPGHNSLVMGPDLRTEYIVYHAWDPAVTTRSLRIDVLRWDGFRPVCDGPTDTPQPMPARPDVDELFGQEELGRFWTADGWDYTRDSIRAVARQAELRLRGTQRNFTAEFSGRGGESWGFRLGDTEARIDRHALTVGGQSTPLPPDFRLEAWHTAHVTRRGGSLTVTLDTYPTVTAEIPLSEASLTLYTTAGGHLGHFALTTR